MIVVTGASGFIGTHVVGQLRQSGCSVLAVDRRPPSMAGDHLVTDISAGDEALCRALTGASAVVHLAGCPGVRDRSPDIDERRRRDNVVATEVVLTATPAATPLIVTSSSSVYGGSRGGRACAETDTPRPIGGYARSKAEVERRCAARRSAGGHVSVVRPFTVIGPGQRCDMALARWIDAASNGRAIEVFGSLQRRRDVTDVRKVAAALIGLLDHESTVLNLGSGRSRSLGELVAAVRAVFGETDIEVIAVPDAEPDETLADTRRCRRLLGVELRTDLSAVVAAQVEAVAARRSEHWSTHRPAGRSAHRSAGALVA